jgi:hypothetical protein
VNNTDTKASLFYTILRSTTDAQTVCLSRTLHCANTETQFAVTAASFTADNTERMQQFF